MYSKFTILQMLKKSTGANFVSEHKFHPVRKWRFDFANLETKTAIEVEGGAYSQGRHTRGSGFIADMEKYNAAIELGWVVLRYTPQQMGKSSTHEQISNVTKNRNQPCD
jgi:very-short-patch-repair endonuclease